MINHQPFYPAWGIPQAQAKPQTGFVVVNTEEEALRYPIAPGNSITFKIESQPIMIEKTMGFSQLDSPQIKRYRIVEEEPAEAPKVISNTFALKEDIERLESEIERLKGMLPKRPVKKKEEEDE